MMTHNLFTLALLGVLLALLAARPDSPAATSPARAWTDLRAAGGKRIARALVQALAGTLALTVAAALRTGLYGAALTLAFLACLAASLVSLDRRPVRLRRGPGVWA
ncbi:hypothetical protein [Nonomuraea sp. NPDC049158]|uniref:hypothetical protein n=1 Tax=Nonomuraea sp. NPDC049158 TaxID=3155649 RepID=UPI0033F9372C